MACEILLGDSFPQNTTSTRRAYTHKWKAQLVVVQGTIILSYPVPFIHPAAPYDIYWEMVRC